MHAHVCACMRMCVRTYSRVCVHAHVCACMCMCVHACACVCMHAHVHACRGYNSPRPTTLVWHETAKVASRLGLVHSWANRRRRNRCWPPPPLRLQCVPKEANLPVDLTTPPPQSVTLQGGAHGGSQSARAVPQAGYVSCSGAPWVRCVTEVDYNATGCASDPPSNW